MHVSSALDTISVLSLLAFEPWLHRHVRRIFPYGRLRALSPEDVCQEVWITVVEHPQAWRSVADPNPRRWLTVVARRVIRHALDEQRSLKRTPLGILVAYDAKVEDVPDLHQDDPAELAARHELIHRALDAFSTDLTHAEQSDVELYCDEAMTPTMIAKTLNKPRRTVSDRLQRALEKLYVALPTGARDDDLHQRKGQRRRRRRIS